jgi:hypothetical protein
MHLVRIMSRPGNEDLHSKKQGLHGNAVPAELVGKCMLNNEI